MPVRNSGYYADPALAEGFSNLSDAFKTPSGSDVYGYANAAATKEKAARLADFYDYSRSRGYDPVTADRMGMAVGNLTGLNTVAAQNQNNVTAQRGQDSTAASATNVANINNAGELARQKIKNIVLSEGQTSFQPPALVADTGFPPMLSAAFKTAPGETITKPDGSVISGIAKPMTTDELKAKILGQQPTEDQRNLVMAPAGVVKVVGKDGEPMNAFTAASVGQKPYEPDVRTRQVGSYAAPDGTKGEAFFDNDTNTWKSTQDQKTLPQGSQVTRTPVTAVNIDTKAPSKIEDAYGEGVGAQIKSTLENAGTAPVRLNQIAQLRDAVNRAGDNITTGPLAATILRLKQGVGGVLGTTLDGVPEAEVINNIGFQLATAASKAISSRPTQFEFGQNLQVKPGITLSKPGMQAVLNISEQSAHDDTELAKLANDPANRQNWTATVQKYYAEHPVMSPFRPGQALGQSDIDKINTPGPAAPAGGAPVSAASAATAAPAGPPAGAVQLLRQNPTMNAAFDAKYGAGAAARALGAQ
jgi:hypothetical protein